MPRKILNILKGIMLSSRVHQFKKEIHNFVLFFINKPEPTSWGI